MVFPLGAALACGGLIALALCLMFSGGANENAEWYAKAANMYLKAAGGQGDARIRDGLVGAALHAQTRAIHIEPFSAELWTGLAGLLEQQGQTGAAGDARRIAEQLSLSRAAASGAAFGPHEEYP